VAIGDLHGDLDATRRALRLAGAIDTDDQWVGGSLMVVQTGDAIDRGDDDREVLELLARLRREAPREGGTFLPLLGNHELFNVTGRFTYVSTAGFAGFAELAPAATPPEAPAGLSADVLGRWTAFRPGGPMARELALRLLVAVIGDTVFAHGGVLPAHVEYGLERLDAEVSAWLSGDIAEAPAAAMEREGILTTRCYAEGEEAAFCATLDEVLAAIPAQRMVIGHTIQKDGITSACNGRLWRIDVGMSKVFGGPIQVLELGSRQTRVLSD
jgi:hypothetical protein